MYWLRRIKVAFELGNLAFKLLSKTINYINKQDLKKELIKKVKKL